MVHVTQVYASSTFPAATLLLSLLCVARILCTSTSYALGDIFNGLIQQHTVTLTELLSVTTLIDLLLAEFLRLLEA